MSNSNGTQQCFLKLMLIIAGFASILTIGSPVSGQESAVEEKVTESSDEAKPDQHELNLKSLDFIFEKIRDSTWEKDFDIEGWTKKRDEIREKITPDTDMDEVRSLMGEMLGWLGKSHFGIMPKELYDGWDDEESDKSGGHAGISFRMVDGKVLVSEVREGSDAESKGVKPGWELTEAKGKSVGEFTEALKDSLPDLMKEHLSTVVGFALQRRMSGAVDSELRLTFLDDKGESQSLKIVRKEQKGEVVEVFNLPKMVIRHEVKELDGGVGYLMFDGFFAPTQIFADLKKAVEIARNGKGLIIDLRGNGGGIGGMAMGIGGPLASDEFDEPQYLGTLITKDMSLKFILTPRLNPYNGPVAVLTDEMSASTSEILAGGLQALKRARIFGARTAGMALPSLIDKLPNGDRFQYAFATYVDAKDRTLEGDGVTPDEKVTLSKDDLLSGKDAVLEAAIKWIAKEAG